jgi:hypothetical protein
MRQRKTLVICNFAEEVIASFCSNPRKRDHHVGENYKILEKNNVNSQLIA